jgi:hypothetical protein
MSGIPTHNAAVVLDAGHALPSLAAVTVTIMSNLTSPPSRARIAKNRKGIISGAGQSLSLSPRVSQDKVNTSSPTNPSANIPRPT